MMKRSLAIISMGAMALGLLVSLAPKANAQVESLKFNCNYDSSSQQYSTVMEGSNSPLIVWTETLASDHPLGAYTPSNRCHAVSTRLTNLAKSIGINNLSEMSKLGYVNGEWVIYNSRYSIPIRDEVVFTLKPGNRMRSNTVLESFRYRVSPVGGPSLPESALNPIVE
ncbi:COP23 domain-containing protein [Lyngbya confervoides]|uniref:COP23 domain-containing protein n=1 Tax=Lyngbya confervoides BDU141951 TaxID=1574623 RepID=A0ABD4T7I4_9CYAN|nr:COP23 domain-containing protein [Lyngbya confervoides]MCM1984711.1 COP23 domain-containing protein [Lyngbya confervoides BDU141951]